MPAPPARNFLTDVRLLRGRVPSHGESFFALFLRRLHGQGLYVLDEPEAALSPSRQLSFLARLHELVQDGSQLIIATHSPILMAYPHATIWLMADGPPRQVPYMETEHYTVTRDVLTRTESMLDILLDRTPDGDGDPAPGFRKGLRSAPARPV